MMMQGVITMAYKDKSSAHEYYLRNKEKILAYQAANKEHIKEQRRKHYEINKEVLLPKMYAYQQANKGKHKMWMQKANAKHRSGLREKVLAAYGNCCACCGETENEFLTVEHVGSWGAKHRREDGWKARGGSLYRQIAEAGFPKDKFGVLCMQCNFATRRGKICPHQRIDVKSLLMGIAC